LTEPGAGTGIHVSAAEAPAPAASAIPAIDSIGFWTKTQMGVGGMLTFMPTPIVLFTSGEALYEMSALGGDLDAYRRAHPGDFTRWRRGGGGVEIIARDGQWKPLPYKTFIGPLPAGYKLERTYTRLSGSGSIAIGGTSSVSVWQTLAFTRDGMFSRDGGASAFDRGNDTRPGVIANSTQATARGTYEVSGFTLTLRYADGRVETRMIAVDQKEPQVIYLDGNGYTSK
jgi:hypothetical protein